MHTGMIFPVACALAGAMLYWFPANMKIAELGRLLFGAAILALLLCCCWRLA